MKTRLWLMVAVGTLLCVTTARSNPGASYAEGWDVSGDLAGWEANTTKTTVAVVDTGGNPNGYLESTCTGAFGDGGQFAGANTTQAALTGDYTGATLWQADVDILFVSGTLTEAFLRFRYQDGTFNGWRYPLTSSLPAGTWQSFSVTFDPTWTDAEATAAGWIRETFSPAAEVDWDVLMTDVYTTEVRILTSVGSVFGIDNYRLTANPTTSPPVFDQPTAPACGSAFDWAALKELTFPIAASDPDLAGPVTVTAVSIPSWGTYTPGADPSTGTFAGTPAAPDEGDHLIHLRATDSDGEQTDCMMTVTVRLDSDGDGLPDAWETDGYTYNGEFVDLPTMGADPNVKDIFVEIDYMDDGMGDSHMPDATALTWIQAAFAAQGITLHINVDQAIPHQTVLGSGADPGSYDWTEVDTLKATYFSEAKSLSIRYCIFAHDISTGDSGVARAGGSDFIVALGTFSGEISDQYDDAGTFMHELGHVLGLRHGGANDTNNKPNYLSVMNYLFQTTGLRKNTAWGTFDYSGAVHPDLDEDNLNEAVGLNAGAAFNAYGTRWILQSTGTKQTVDAVNGPINWDGDGNDSESGVDTDINGDGITFLAPLAGYNDWANLVYDGGTIGAGTPIPAPVVTPADELDQTIIDTTQPDLKAKGHVSAKKLHLTWKPVDGVDIVYRIYRSVDGEDYELRGETTVSNFDDLDVESGKTYSYQVTWVQYGVESQPTDDITLELKR